LDVTNALSHVQTSYAVVSQTSSNSYPFLKSIYQFIFEQNYFQLSDLKS